MALVGLPQNAWSAESFLKESKIAIAQRKARIDLSKFRNSRELFDEILNEISIFEAVSYFDCEAYLIRVYF